MIQLYTKIQQAIIPFRKKKLSRMQVKHFGSENKKGFELWQKVKSSGQLVNSLRGWTTLNKRKGLLFEKLPKACFSTPHYCSSYYYYQYFSRKFFIFFYLFEYLHFLTRSFSRKEPTFFCKLLINRLLFLLSMYLEISCQQSTVFYLKFKVAHQTR